MKRFLTTIIILTSYIGALMAQDSLTIEGTIDKKFDNKEIRLSKYIGYKNFIVAPLELSSLIKDGHFKFKLAAKTAEVYQLSCVDFKKNRDGNYGNKKIEFIAENGLFQINIDSNFHKKIIQGSVLWNTERDSLEYYLRVDLFDPSQIKTTKINFLQTHPTNPYSSTILLDLHNEIEDDKLDSLSKLLPLQQYDNSTGKFIKALVDNTIVGKFILDFQLPDTTGKIVSNKVFRGKYVLYDFWASWCIPCRKENPYFKKLKTKYGDKLEIVQISFDNSKNAWIDAIKQDQTEMWIHLSELKGWDNTLSRKFNIMSIPANILVDPNGLIISRNLRGNKLIDTITKIMKVL